jgi:TolB-like protein
MAGMCFGWILFAAGPMLPVCHGEAVAEVASGKVLVLPFVSLNQAEFQPWLGRSIQQSVLADLMMSAPGRALSGDVAAKDADAALDAARTAGAQYVVRGNYVSAGDDVRVTGEVLDVNTAKAVGALKATGPFNNVFAIEDELAAQIRSRVGMRPAAGPLTPAPEPVQPMQPLQVQPGSANPYEQAYGTPAQYAPSSIEYNYYYSDPYSDYVPSLDSYYGWGWPGWGLGVAYIYYPGRYHHYRGWSNYSYQHFSGAGRSSNTRWNGSYAAGVANSAGGTPLSGSGGLRTGGGPRSSGVVRAGTAGHSSGISPARSSRSISHGSAPAVSHSIPMHIGGSMHVGMGAGMAVHR